MFPIEPAARWALRTRERAAVTLLCAIRVEVALSLLGELVQIGVLVFGRHNVWFDFGVDSFGRA